MIVTLALTPEQQNELDTTGETMWNDGIKITRKPKELTKDDIDLIIKKSRGLS